MINFSEKLALINKYRETAPVNIEELVYALGLRLAFLDLGPEISGIIKKEGEKFNIFINERDSKVRQRFTIAHELGHYMLHYDKIGDGIEDNRAYRSQVLTGKYKNTKIGKAEETEANQFAANMLMPWNLIHKLHGDGITNDKAFAEKLEVSKAAISIRLNEFSLNNNLASKEASEN